MGSNEKFCLRWNDFETNISAAFRELRDDKDFFDVTIACDDSQLQAHKVILSACSPFFRNILRKNPHQHPLLYLKGVKFKELVSVLNFMYMGEVNVAQEELNSFLSVAEELRVKGLTQNSSDSAKPSDHHKSNSRSREPPDGELANSGPPQKKFRPSGSTSGGVSQPLSATTTGSVVRPSAQHHSQHHSHQQPNNTVPDDDIQEVVPVKSEPRDTTVQSLGHQQQPVALSRDDSQNYPEVGQPGTVALQENYQEDVYDYESFEGYDDGSYDQTTGQSAGQDGNKGPIINSADFFPNGTSSGGATSGDDVDWKGETLRRMNKAEGLWCCSDCSYSSKVRTLLLSHIQSQHLPGFPGFRCSICGSHSTTYSGLEKHTSRQHSITLSKLNSKSGPAHE